jgi:hypothetical protein
MAKPLLFRLVFFYAEWHEGEKDEIIQALSARSTHML